MKRFVSWLVLSLLFSLTACSSKDHVPSQEKGTMSRSPEAGSLIHVSEMFGRYGWKDGFYMSQSSHDNDFENLMYIDYNSKKKVYLCNKADCQHKDETCSSYIPIEGAQGLFVDQGKLYRLSNAYSADGQTVVPGLYVSDLDGTNARMLMQLESGMSWLRDFVFGNGMLYADVMVMESLDEDGSGEGVFAVGDDQNSRLLAVDLSSGKTEIVLDLKDKRIMGTDQDNIVLSESKNGRLVFSRFAPDGKTEVLIDEIAPTSAVTSGNGKIYYALPDEGTLNALDILRGESSVLAVLSAAPDFLEYHGGMILCTRWDSTAIQVVDADSGSLCNVDLPLSGIAERFPVNVQAEWNDMFLIVYGYQMETEYVAWAGVWQDYIDDELFALVKKDDFLAGKPEYQKIKE